MDLTAVEGIVSFFDYAGLTAWKRIHRSRLKSIYVEWAASTSALRLRRIPYLTYQVCYSGGAANSLLVSKVQRQHKCR